jgi:hypothetical protein
MVHRLTREYVSMILVSFIREAIYCGVDNILRRGVPVVSIATESLARCTR